MPCIFKQPWSNETLYLPLVNKKTLLQKYKMAFRLNLWATISSLGALCSSEYIDEMMTWLEENEQLAGFPKPW
jgi:hypothetical protein